MSAFVYVCVSTDDSRDKFFMPQSVSAEWLCLCETCDTVPFVAHMSERNLCTTRATSMYSFLSEILFVTFSLPATSSLVCLSRSFDDFLLLFFTFLLLLRLLLFRLNVLCHTFGRKSDFSQLWIRMGNRKSGNGSTPHSLYACLTSTTAESMCGKRCIHEKNDRKKRRFKKNHLIFSSTWFSTRLRSSLRAQLTHTLSHSCHFFYAPLHIVSTNSHTYAISIYANVLSQTHISLGKVRYWKTTSIFSEINADKNVDWTSTLVWYISRINCGTLAHVLALSQTKYRLGNWVQCVPIARVYAVHDTLEIVHKIRSLTYATDAYAHASFVRPHDDAKPRRRRKSEKRWQGIGAWFFILFIYTIQFICQHKLDTAIKIK